VRLQQFHNKNVPLQESPLDLTNSLLSAETAGGISVADVAVTGGIVLLGIYVARKAFNAAIGTQS